MYTILNIKFYYVYNIRILPTVAAAGNESPDELMQVMMPLLENEICNQPTWHNHSLDDSMVCAGYEENGLGNCNVKLFFVMHIWDAVLMRRQSGIEVTGGSRGGPNPAMPPIQSVNGTWPLSRQKFLPHKNGTQPSFCPFCLLSTSLNFRTHNN